MIRQDSSDKQFVYAHSTCKWEWCDSQNCSLCLQALWYLQNNALQLRNVQLKNMFLDYIIMTNVKLHQKACFSWLSISNIRESSSNSGSVRFVCVHGSPMQSHENKQALIKTSLVRTKLFKMDYIACPNQTQRNVATWWTLTFHIIPQFT